MMSECASSMGLRRSERLIRFKACKTPVLSNLSSARVSGPSADDGVLRVDEQGNGDSSLGEYCICHLRQNPSLLPTWRIVNVSTSSHAF